MTDPGSSMSPTAVLVLTAVVLVLIAGWLGAVFFAGRQPGAGRRGAGHPPGAGQPQAAPGEPSAGSAGHAE